MADPFDSMISGGASSALFGASRLFGERRAQNAALADAQAARDQNMLQFTLGLAAQERQAQREQNQFALQSRTADMALAERREENAFARLNSILDRQLKVAELESRDRQQAFENSLRLQSASVEARRNALMLEEMEGKTRAMRSYREWNGNLSKLRAGGGGETPGAIADRLVEIASRGDFSYLGPDMEKALNDQLGFVVQLTGRYSTAKSSPVGTRLTIENANRLIGNLTLDGPPSAETIDALGELLDRSGGKSLPSSEQRLKAMQDYANGMAKRVPHLKQAAQALSDGAAQVRVLSLLDSGVVRATVSKDEFAKLFEHRETVNNLKTALDKETGGMWRFAKEGEMRDLRDRVEEFENDGEAEILSGGNPRAKLALEGGASSFMDVHSKISPVVRDAIGINQIGRGQDGTAAGVRDRSFAGNLKRYAMGVTVIPAVVSGLGDDARMSELEFKAKQVEDAREMMITASAGGRLDGSVVASGLSALSDYYTTVESYFKRVDGYVPAEVRRLMDPKLVYPPRYAEAISKRLSSSTLGIPVSEEDPLSKFLLGGSVRQQSAEPAAAPATLPWSTVETAE